MSKSTFNLGNNEESYFTSSSQAAYKKPSTENQGGQNSGKPTKIQQRSTFSLGSENDNQSYFVSSNNASYGNGQVKPAQKNNGSSNVSTSNFVTTSSSSYGSPSAPRKQVDKPIKVEEPSNYVGRHSISAARYASADNVLASYGSNQQNHGQGQVQAQEPVQDNSSSFITSNAAAYKNPSGSSSSSSRPTNNNNNDNSSNFQSSNSSYGKKSVSKVDAPAAGSFGRGPQAARSESGNFQIGFSTDSNFATSNSVAFSKPTNDKERLQDHSKHAIRHAPADSDNPLGPTSLNQGILPSPSTSSISSTSSQHSCGNNNCNNNNNSNDSSNSGSGNQAGSRQISERHRGLQRSSFNPITGE